jgi:hypothetical protein
MPVLFCLQLAGASRGARIAIVNERDPMSNEDVVFDRHALANKCVARNLAAVTDLRILLDLYESADLRLIADFTAIKIDELREHYVLAQLDVS